MTSARRGIEEYFLDRDAAGEVSAGVMALVVASAPGQKSTPL